MATIKDVAVRAGVSSGTVSNVLNGKQVSPKKARLVRDAIKVLGYTPNFTARSLKTNQTMNVGVILPTISDPGFAQVYTGVERVLGETGYTASLYITSEISANEIRIIDTIFQQNWDGIILATCQPDNDYFFDELEKSRSAVVFIEREIPGKKFNFVGFNNISSIFHEVPHYLREGFEKFLVLTGPINYSSENEVLNAVTDAVGRELSTSEETVRHVETNFDRESSFKAMVGLLQRGYKPEVIITTATPLLEGVLQALAITRTVSTGAPKILSLGEDTWTDSYYPNTRIIPRQTMKAGEIAAELLLQAINKPNLHESMHRKIDNRSVRTSIQSFSDSVPAVTKTRDKVKVLMLEGNASSATSALLADFNSGYNLDADIECLSYERLYERILSESQRDAVDVFQVDLAWSSDFIYDGMLENLDDYISSVPEVTSEYIPGVLESYARQNGRYYGLPYLFGTQILFYRKDLFSNPELKLLFKERYGTDLSPPTNWTEFNAIAKFFTKRYNPQSPVEYGTTLGGAYSSGAVCEFLPRMWAFEGKPLDSYGRVSLSSQETRWALENYAESFAYASPDSINNWWDEQVEEFSAGNTAMMILFVAHVTNIVDRNRSKVVGKIGYAVIPGGKPVLGGWSLGINRNSRRKDEAFKFVRWATGREVAIPYAILGGATPSLNLYKSSELVEIYPWLPKVLEVFPRSRKRNVSKVTTGGKISERQYELILGEAVHKAVTGELQAAEALHRADLAMNALLDRPGEINNIEERRNGYKFN